MVTHAHDGAQMTRGRTAAVAVGETAPDGEIAPRGQPATAQAPDAGLPGPAADGSSSVAIGELLSWAEQLRSSIAALTALRADLDEQILRIVSTPGPPARPTDSAPVRSAHAPVPTPHHRVFDGVVTLDVGPFPDFTAVAKFTRAIQRVPGLGDASVTAFSGERAHVEIDLGQPIALGREMRSVVPFNVAIVETQPGHLKVDLSNGALR
jgi:hypothetical protein